MIDLPPSWIVEGVNDLACNVHQHTGRKGLVRVTLDRDTALAFGLLPGQSMKLATAAGYVEIAADAPLFPLDPAP